MLSEWIAKAWWRRTNSHEGLRWDELEQFPGRPPDEQRRILSERLLRQIRYFGTREDALPEWREAAKIGDAGELWRIWPSLPVMTKDTLRGWMPPQEIQARFHLQGRISSTGGSTGEPTSFFHDQAIVAAKSSATAYARLRMGWRPGMAVIVLWGSERDIGKLMSRRNRVNLRLHRNFLVDGYEMRRGTVERVLELIRRNRPVAIYGFTSMLEYVAAETLAMNAAPAAGSVRTAWNGGEMLLPRQVEIFRKAFGVPILNSYGGRELPVMAAQFEDGGALHVFRPWLFLEVLDDRGKHVAPGETGRLVWTCTVGRGTPFLRYDIGDLGVFDAEHRSEAGVWALRELQGRSASVVELASGKKIHNLYWNHLFKEFPEVLQFQVRVTPGGGLRLLLKGAGFPASREAELRRLVHDFAGDLPPIAISWVDRIPLTSQGKLLQVVREQPGDPHQPA